jgi:UDP-2,3-diacylglucosamine hydrolase
LFLKFLNQFVQSSDCIYILGDLFEVYIGDDDPNPVISETIRAIKIATSRRIKIYYLHGNRDFLIDSFFFRESGCKLLQEESVIDLHGRRILLMHGDTLCTHDHAYLRTRRIFRNPVIKWLFLKLPLSFRKKIANRLRLKSKQYTQTVARDLMDVVQETVEAKMHAHQVQYLIHGHTHLPAIHHFYSTQSMQRLVLGAWHHDAFILQSNADHNLELIDLMKLTF